MCVQFRTEEARVFNKAILYPRSVLKSVILKLFLEMSSYVFACGLCVFVVCVCVCVCVCVYVCVRVGVCFYSFPLRERGDGVLRKSPTMTAVLMYSNRLLILWLLQGGTQSRRAVNRMTHTLRHTHTHTHRLPPVVVLNT